MVTVMRLAGQRVTVVGLARSGLSAARWLLDQDALVTVTEAQETERTRAAAQELRHYAAVGKRLTLELGAHTPASVERAYLVVVSPGVPETAPVLGWAKARGVPVISEVELAARYCPAPIVAVTGTNGKTTVTTLIGRLLEASGRVTEVCGNIGRPFCDALKALTPEAVAVLEVSSFQLLRCPTLRPRVAVLLNLSENHLDRHPTFEAYVQAKARLFANQTAEDWAVLNAADVNVRWAAQTARSRAVWFNRDGSEAQARWQNPDFEAAACAARLFDVPEDAIASTLRDFRGLEHRLETVATVRGVTFINDSKSTTPASLLWALQRRREPLVLIVGGRNKGCDFAPVREALQGSSVRQVLLLGEARAQLRQMLEGGAPLAEVASLEEAVERGLAFAPQGGAVLLSPGCASFDMFANYEERGRRFKALVAALAAAQDATASVGPRA